MNENIENRIIELIDAGKTAENSSELKDIIESSDEAKQFYYNFLQSDSDLKEFYGNASSKLDKQIDEFDSKNLNKNPLKQTNYFKPVIGLAIAASLAAIGFTFLNSPADIINTNNTSEIELVYSEFEEMPSENSEPMYISGSEIDTLWSTASRMAKELGVNRYEIMYVVYEGNKDSFIDNNINMPRNDREFSVDLSIVEDLETNFVINEVKRHIFCSC